MYFLGIDLGSSSIKLAVLDANTGKSVVGCTVPEHEMIMDTPQSGWAEQEPEQWWNYTCRGIQEIERKY